MTEDEINRVIDRAVEQAVAKAVSQVGVTAINKAVERTFLTIGADISTPEGVIEVQEDFRHLRRHRKVSQALGMKAILTVMATVLGIVIAIVLERLGITKW